jgi:hypothetical protein
VKVAEGYQEILELPQEEADAVEASLRKGES